MLDECNGCKYIRKDDACKLIIETDPYFRSLNCPCFSCLLKVVCTDECHKQFSYIRNRFRISQNRLYEIEVRTQKIYTGTLRE